MLLPKTTRAPKKPPRRSSPPDRLRSSGSILVVDDEEDVRKMLGTLLPRFGLEVRLAAQGSEAAALLSDPSIDVAAVLLDLTMPDMAGDEALRQIRAIRPEIPVVLMSGYSDAPPNISGVGRTEFLQKPFTNEELRNALHRVLPGVPPAD